MWGYEDHATHKGMTNISPQCDPGRAINRENVLSGTVADYVITSLKQRGTRRMFGVPGGGSSLDLIEAGEKQGIKFVLTQTETSAALMAAVTAELSGTPGAILTGVGPRAASAANGIAYASLEKSSVVLLTDRQKDSSSSHQVFDQQALFHPLTKGSRNITDGNVEDIQDLLNVASTLPYGPVHIDLTADGASRPAAKFAGLPEIEREQITGDTEAAHHLLRQSRKPVILVGLDARSGEAAEHLCLLSSRLNAPVLTTYKAKGVFPDDAPHMIGMFTGAAAEQESILKADLIIFYGLDPVELIPGVWPYSAPVLELSPYNGHQLPITPEAGLYGALPDIVASLRPTLTSGNWTNEEISNLRQRMSERLSLSTPGRNAETVTRAVQGVAPGGTRLTVDAGAHMISAMATWQALAPFGALKSNGLSTMGFALPAAIASSLEQPEVPVVAITGDGGMMMCIGELATAKRVGKKIVCVVLNDASLSLIDIKQQRRQQTSIGVTYPRNNFAKIAEGFGCRGWLVGAEDDLDAALLAAFNCDGPAVVDVTVDATGYAAQLEALRG
jgi:acetolactate synthase I/II/III large subunit